jgi:predicted regulator of amino acid metabolism with ACT domain
MTLEEQIAELTSLVRTLDTKILFLQQDLEEHKGVLAEIMHTLITITINMENLKTTAPDANKTAKLAEFHKESARWG